MKRPNIVLALVTDGHLTREDVSPGETYGEAGRKASHILAVSLAHYGVGAPWIDLAEARSVLGLPASIDALREEAEAARRRSRRRRRSSSPLVFRSSTSAA